MSKHTKGPWQAVEAGKGFPRTVVTTTTRGGSETVADCAWRPGAVAEDEANARLIEAACNAAMEVNPENPVAAAEALPDLLVACEAALEAYTIMTNREWHKGGGLAHDVSEQCRNAIRKTAEVGA